MIEAKFDTAKVIKALEALPTNIQKNIMVGATRASAKVVSDAAKYNIASKNLIDTGALWESIGVTKRRSKKRSIVSFSVSPRKGGKNSGWYGRFLELGTSKMDAKPFLRPAMENTVDETLQASKDYIAKRLPEEVAKAKR